MTRSIVSVIGCGWLGLPLARRMLKLGFDVKGTTTSRSKMAVLKREGIRPFLFDFNSGELPDKEILDSGFLIVNVPPGRRDPEKLSRYSQAIGDLLQEAASFRSISKVVFVSSTSVYGEDLDEYTEETPAMPLTASGKVLREAEVQVVESGIPYIILRFGGLAGPNRHPGKFLAGRKDLPIGEQSINFLHLEDAIRVVIYMVENDIKDEIFNVVSPKHPKKKLFYPSMAASLGMESPTFAVSGGKIKREVSVNKLLTATDFEFRFPDPMQYSFED